MNNIYNIIDKLKPMDDIFFAKLSESIEFCEEILQVIMQKKDLRVVEARTQMSLRNVKGRSVVVDVLCKDSLDNYYNIEIQKEDNDNHEKRVRYNGSNIDTFVTEKGTAFSEMPDVYVIYISRFDCFNENKTIYHVDRFLRETGRIVDNGFYEIYVNTKVDDGTDIAELMRILESSSVETSQRFPVICQTIGHFKEERGGEGMCELVEEYAKEYAKEHAVEYARDYVQEYAEEYAKEHAVEYAREMIVSMIQQGISLDIVSKVAKISIAEVEEIAKSVDMK